MKREKIICRFIIVDSELSTLVGSREEKIEEERREEDDRLVMLQIGLFILW